MRVGIFGGTFDPVHEGHIAMAQYAKDAFELEKIIFVPNGNPPHKKGKRIESFYHRFNMLALACKGHDSFEISDCENRAEYSYSLDTMRFFRSRYSDAYFIIGADSLLTIHLWHEYETLLRENKFIVFSRGENGELVRCADKYRKRGAEIYIARMDEFAASSTQIRTLVAQGKSTEGLLNPEVEKYIKKHGLYGG